MLSGSMPGSAIPLGKLSPAGETNVRGTSVVVLLSRSFDRDKELG